MAQPAPRTPGVFARWDGNGAVDAAAAPGWWPSTAEESERLLRSLRGVKVFEIGRSAGGRSILAGAWGRREDLPNRTCRSLASAIAGGSVAAFYGEGQRARQSLVFVGNAHGLEFEGTVAALNMLSVVVTGKDLRGRAWPRLQRYGRKLRLVVIPHLNIDGRARVPWYRHSVGINDEDVRRLFFGDWKRGGRLEWARSKLTSPVPPDQVAPLGAYFNDHGVNLVYDTGLGVDPQPETKALLGFLREEMPDCVLLSHTDAGGLVQPPDAFIPERYRQRQAQIAALVGARCKYEGSPIWRIPQESHGSGGEALYQSDVVYHTCGALPLMVEFPAGYHATPGRFGEILDVGLYVLEEVLAFGAEFRFRPYDP